MISATASVYISRGILSGSHPSVRPAHVTHFERSVRIARPPAEVFTFCLRSQNFASIMPDRIAPLDGTRLVVEAGGTYAFRWWMRNLVPVRWVAHIEELVPGREFVDVQLRGAFRYFRHTHTCLAFPDSDGTLYRDSVEFATLLGASIDRRLVRRELERTFAHRHARMRAKLEAVDQ